MRIEEMLEELRKQQRALEEAVGTLERLASGGARRRGRPPKWLVRERAGGNGSTAVSVPGTAPMPVTTPTPIAPSATSPTKKRRKRRSAKAAPAQPVGV